MSPTIDWWWPTAPNGQIASRGLNLVNTVPKWSTVGEFSPGASSLYSSYVQVLQQVDPSVSPDRQQAWTDAHNNFVSASNTWQNDQNAMYRAWTVMNANLPTGVPAPDFTTWQKSSGWADTLLTDQQQIAKAQQVAADVTGQQNPELRQALQAAALPDKNAVKAGFTQVDQGDGTLVSAPAYTIGVSGQDWVNLLSRGGGNPTSISISQSKSSDNMTKSWASADGSIDEGFWSVEGSGGWEQLNVDQSDQAVTAKIEMTTTYVQVTPGQWYDGGYMKTLTGSGKFFSPWTPKGPSSPVFGEGGLLPLMINGFVAAHQPSFTITMSQSTYNQAYQKFDGATGVRIGPFTFGGRGGHESNAVKKSASNGSFTGKSTATYPFIIGVTVAKPGVD